MALRLPLAGLRDLVEGTLPETCTIQRYTETVTGDGTQQSWADLATAVPCRVSPTGRLSGETLGPADSIQAVGRWSISLLTGQDVTVRDRIVVGARTFEVADVVARSYEVVRVALCREIT